MTRVRYQIDPHLRYDYSPPRPRLARWTRLRLWWYRRLYLLGQWSWRYYRQLANPEVAALQLLILGLLMIVLFQAFLLVLLRPR